MPYTALLLLLLAAPAPAPYDAKCVGVHDGDTLTVQVRGVDRVIRLAEIDAPELKQPHGPQARAALARVVLGQTVTIEPVTTDRYGRTVAHVFRPQPAGRIWLNAQLVRDGHAWQYTQYSKSQSLADLQTRARRQRLGLWSADEPQAPWEFRRKHRQGRQERRKRKIAVARPERFATVSAFSALSASLAV